ncbi:Rrf2 family transcriptional regulator [Collinsella sp. AGMB00827]|uniref:Rrf2 family transcriptional regulator n=1 Tax=Collinsella ureilytica TaxID=2869515 RepID=A0ABS7MLM9_9ACTN|nr:Rrf2 family transcriptional regulator [Collinsella urealyticum]MBY4798274.1 Rrf2 family transcriptional regulator [Collinsella urealyticum]
MLVSTKGRYAIRILVELASFGVNARVPLREIATRQNISEKYLESIIAMLVRADLVAGVRGKGGGYRLVRPAKDISVGEVLRASEGSLAPVACLCDTADPEERSREGSSLKMWEELERIITEYVDSMTIEDLKEEPEVYSYVI